MGELAPDGGVDDGFDPTEKQYDEFFRSNHHRALVLVRSRTDGCDCEALVADAFLLAWEHFDQTGRLDEAWLFQVLRNKFGEFYRSRKRRGLTREAESAEDRPVCDTADSSNTTIDVDRVLRSLPDAQREPLVLVYWCDLTGPEAAAVLGIREGTFRVRLHRAQRAFLRKLDSSAAREE